MGLQGVRKTAVAGGFYPGEPWALSTDVNRMMAEAAVHAERARSGAGVTTWPKAVIAPHAGYVYSGKIAASAYTRLMPGRGTVKRVILAGPGHRVAVKGIALPSVAAFQSPVGDIILDEAGLQQLLTLPFCQVRDDAHAAEHSLEVHLPFIHHVFGADVTLVPMVVGAITPPQMQQALEMVWGDEETVVIISSDLSHFLSDAEAQKLDAQTTAAIESLRPEAIADAGACGRMPVKGLLLQAQKYDLRATTIDLRNSGHTAGPKDRVVGYGAWVFEPNATTQLSRSDRTLSLSLIRQGLSYAVAHQGCAPAVALHSFPLGLRALRACFVTLTKKGALRGCIGSLVAHRPLAVDLIENAVKAGFHDTRFSPVTLKELPELEAEVSILGAASALSFTDEDDVKQQLRPLVDGVILSDGRHRGLFLPHVWKGLPGVDQFMAQLKRKAGLPPTHWSSTIQIQRFSTETFGLHDVQ